MPPICLLEARQLELHGTKAESMVRRQKGPEQDSRRVPGRIGQGFRAGKAGTYRVRCGQSAGEHGPNSAGEREEHGARPANMEREA